MSPAPENATEQSSMNLSQSPTMIGDAIIDIGENDVADSTEERSRWWKRKPKPKIAAIEEIVNPPRKCYQIIEARRC